MDPVAPLPKPVLLPVDCCKPGATPLVPGCVGVVVPLPNRPLSTLARCAALPFCTGYTKSCGSDALAPGLSSLSIQRRASSRYAAREVTTMTLLMRSMGSMRRAPKSGNAVADASAARAAAAAAAAAPGPPPVGAGVAAAPPDPSSRMAASTSPAVTYFKGNTPTDMPLSKSTSKVDTMSSQPSAWLRVPTSTSKLRTESTRTMASGGAMGRKMLAISGAPMNLRGTTTAP